MATKFLKTPLNIVQGLNRSRPENLMLEKAAPVKKLVLLLRKARTQKPHSSRTSFPPNSPLQNPIPEIEFLLYSLLPTRTFTACSRSSTAANSPAVRRDAIHLSRLRQNQSPSLLCTSACKLQLQLVKG